MARCGGLSYQTVGGLDVRTVTRGSSPPPNAWPERGRVRARGAAAAAPDPERDRFRSGLPGVREPAADDPDRGERGGGARIHLGDAGRPHGREGEVPDQGQERRPVPGRVHAAGSHPRSGPGRRHGPRGPGHRGPELRVRHHHPDHLQLPGRHDPRQLRDHLPGQGGRRRDGAGRRCAGHDPAGGQVRGLSPVGLGTRVAGDVQQRLHGRTDEPDLDVQRRDPRWDREPQRHRSKPIHPWPQDGDLRMHRHGGPDLHLRGAAPGGQRRWD